MNSNQSWVVVADEPALTGLVTTARELAPQVVAVVVGSRAAADAAARAADRVVWLGEPGQVPVEAYATAVADVVAAAAPAAVVGATSPAARALLGAVAARLGAPVLSNVQQVEAAADGAVVTHAVLGGLVEHRTGVAGVPVLAVDAGAVPADGPAVPVEESPATPLGGVTITQVRPRERTGGDLGSARTVVAIGRGLRAEADLAIVTALTDALGGELACSRPLAEGVDWVSKDRYIGISGQRVSPDLYLAIGISGQLQHMVGVRGAGTVVAINSDKDAPVFAQCDYGIVGDLYDVVPALTAALGGGA
ncbi:electron transfer flavoprotein subunit alpha/FixB family protein [Cellulomonas iranensis]|uniref:electron transfer flavoprotein subunit alpha/FixB family protein n=1 Tax=Cellulomonas iranensis TaxID=76862 RepID=UPI0013CFF287|nr:electron transfer flavoprotein subunit alpha/FixB family protein [Cellulomonas iranensis]